MKPEYILEKVDGKPTLYHLKVKDSNNLMVETNLFFDLKEEPARYDSFVISQSNDEYILYSSIKNTKITLWEGDWFHDKVGKGLNISNSVIEGDYTIETKYRNRNKALPINIENSSLARGFLYIEKDFSVDDKSISIINSDIDYNVDAINLDLIEASVIKGPVRFNGVREIKDTMIDQVNFEDSKINKIEGGSYLANGKIIEGSEHTKTGKVTEDLELL